MFCPSCGVALSQQTKYCNRCGAQLVPTKETSETEQAGQEFGEYLEGLFWIAVWGLGLILGGMVLMKKVLQLNTGLIVAYMILGSVAFSIIFALCLWKTLSLARSSNRRPEQTGNPDTNELIPAKSQAALEAAPSVTEPTTRRLEESSKEPAIR